jgi:hypothetical protein
MVVPFAIIARGVAKVAVARPGRAPFVPGHHVGGKIQMSDAARGVEV